MERNPAIDILKFCAVIIVTHSHMDALYGPYGWVCTGGAIGDSLFFFISGFTLMLGSTCRFDNWYKRRIVRIYPTVLAWALACCLMFGNSDDFVSVILHGGGTFVSCIMVCYIPFFFITRYLGKHLISVFCFNLLVIAGVFFLFCEDKSGMYSSNSILWPLWGFSMMLLGAICSSYSNFLRLNPLSAVKELLGLSAGLAMLYAMFYAGWNVPELAILALFPLYLTIFFIFRLCSCQSVTAFYYRNRIAHCVISTIGALCLEVYMVQSSVLSFCGSLTVPFPVNVLIAWAFVFIAAYLLKVSATFIRQTFNGAEYDWHKLFKL